MTWESYYKHLVDAFKADDENGTPYERECAECHRKFWTAQPRCTCPECAASALVESCMKEEGE